MLLMQVKLLLEVATADADVVDASDGADASEAVARDSDC